MALLTIFKKNFKSHAHFQKKIMFTIIFTGIIREKAKCYRNWFS